MRGEGGWLFNDNYSVGGTDRYHWQLQGDPPHQVYFIPSSKLKKIITFIKTLLLIMFGWTSTFKYYYETPNDVAVRTCSEIGGQKVLDPPPCSLSLLGNLGI